MSSEDSEFGTLAGLALILFAFPVGIGGCTLLCKIDLSPQSSQHAPAQNSPKIPQATEIQKGILENKNLTPQREAENPDQ